MIKKDVNRYLASIRSVAPVAIIASILMLVSGYPPEDWVGVFVIWYVSFIAIGLVTFRAILVPFEACRRYTDRIIGGPVPDEPPEEVSMVAKAIATIVISCLMLMVLGMSLIVTGVAAPLVGLADLGERFMDVSTYLLGAGFGGVMGFFLGIILLLERVKRRKKNSGRPRASRLRLSDNAINALRRLRHYEPTSAGVLAGPFG